MGTNIVEEAVACHVARNPANTFYHVHLEPSILDSWSSLLLVCTALGLLLSAAIKFIEHARNPRPLVKSRGHPFSTLGMSLAIASLFPFWYLPMMGQVPLQGAAMPDFVFGKEYFSTGWLARLNPFFDFPANTLEVYLQAKFFLVALGVAMVLFAFCWHILAKFNLRLMWSDNIEIKRDHQLVTTGAYALARHPMYASLLMWCWGGSLIMDNLMTLLITTFVILPLMRARAKAEETELLAARPDYAFYQRNVRMLTPTLRGACALAFKIIMIAVLGFWVFACTFCRREYGETLPFPILVTLVFTHAYLGFSLTPEKVAFSYRSKSGMMAVFWGLSLWWPPFFYVFWLLLAMFVYGLFFNCPCMWVYEKFGGCPCFALFRKKRCRV